MIKYIFGFIHGGVWSSLLILSIIGIQRGWEFFPLFLVPLSVITLVSGVKWGVAIFDSWHNK